MSPTHYRSHRSRLSMVRTMELQGIAVAKLWDGKYQEPRQPLVPSGSVLLILAGSGSHSPSWGCQGLNLGPCPYKIMGSPLIQISIVREETGWGRQEAFMRWENGFCGCGGIMKGSNIRDVATC